ncbi:hypothetical protein EZJ19_00460 [Parasulfuritortus cantonensis]|uniref:DUF4105 domain-containing protein n=1 Tax=Parasulfuritortus cantonensis TaxID=2528202 RepID=A0A4R1BRX4_9PROT|nr:hypothetical protein [Parasulfuritortus cantonensis]TCJ20401.1 hypothetical protein EZJ19_00460 [Parasulfuritortus cantonensis]
MAGSSVPGVTCNVFNTVINHEGSLFSKAWSTPGPVAVERCNRQLEIRFDGLHVGLVVRGKTGIGHAPGVLQQHADCVLPNGAPVGFFGDGGDWSSGWDRSGSSGSSGSSSGSSSQSSRPGPSASSNISGMNMKGTVFYYEDFERRRPQYVSADKAREVEAVSTLLLVTVTAEQAKAFTKYWQDRRAQPGDFYLLGHNCSSHAAEAFIEAGIVSEGIPGLDTPDNFYNQLANVLGAKATSYAGYLDFQRAGAGFTCYVYPTS